jgi:hypothetical protein
MLDIFKNLQTSKFQGAFLYTNDIIDYLNVQYYPKMSFIAAKQDILIFNICFYYPKTSCLPQQFNKWISKLLTNGFIQIWIENSYDNNLSKKIGKAPQKLKFSHLEGGFMLFVYGLLLSTFVYLLEVLSEKSKMLKNKLFSAI